jgi:hypothetical protein
MEYARRRYINQRKNDKMTYYYYDKVLVSNCRLRSLTDYAGKMTKDSVVQLSAQVVDPNAAVLKGCGEIVFTEDFYQVTVPEKVTYQIHKDGNLVRAYAADLLWVEQTILGIPASILALLKGKVLLNGSLLHAGRWAYAVIGERESRIDDMYLRCGIPGRAVMVRQQEEQFVGTAHSDSAYLDCAVEALGLLGVFVLQSNEAKAAIEPMCLPELKKDSLLESVVGYEVFSQELMQLADESGIIDQISRKLYMAFMRAL